MDGYYNPLRALTSLWPQEVDQGVDYCASGPIYAIGDGVVANVYSSGWPSGVFISYRLTSGPAKGLYVYDAEDVTPTVSVGERVTPTTIVGQLHDAATCLETGWADPPGAHSARSGAPRVQREKLNGVRTQLQHPARRPGFTTGTPPTRRTAWTAAHPLADLVRAA